MRVLTDSVLDMMGGRTVIEAETILDTARRLIWVYCFSGRPFETVAREIDATQEAVDVAVMMMAETSEAAGASGGSPSAHMPMIQRFGRMDSIFGEIRLTLYIATYRSDPDSTFARFARSMEEEASRYAAPPRTAAALN